MKATFNNRSLNDKSKGTPLSMTDVFRMAQIDCGEIISEQMKQRLAWYVYDLVANAAGRLDSAEGVWSRIKERVQD